MTAQAPEDGRDITMPLNHLTAAQSGEFSGARYDPRTVIETACRYGLPSDTPPPDAAHRTAPHRPAAMAAMAAPAARTIISPGWHYAAANFGGTINRQPEG
jgi:hypothetical protein